MKAKLIKENGVNYIEINGEKINPTSFRSFWPAPHTTKAFAESGIRLMTVFPTGLISSLNTPYSQFGEYWTGEGEYNWQALRNQMDQFIENAPNAYFSLMLMFDTRDWYLKNHPEASDSFHHIANMAGDENWRECGKRMLRDVLDFLDREYPEKIFCVYVCAGSTCEWLNLYDNDELNPLKQKCFASYSGDPLRKTPDAKGLEHTSKGIFRDPSIDKDALDYWHFNSEIIADALCYFAKAVKEIRPNLLVGCFYGYFIFNSLRNGHTDLHHILSCSDIDMFFSPASYYYRGLESVSSSQLPVDAVTIHGKLYYHEIDNTTVFANGNLYAQVLQSCGHRRHESFEETVHYLRREAAFMMSKRQRFWWFDMFGGWYDDPRIVEELKKIRLAYEEMAKVPVRSASEIAVMIDGESIYYTSDLSPLHEELIKEMHEITGKMGCPVDYYETNDLLLPEFPKGNYKLYIFPNLFAPTKELRCEIQKLRKDGANLLFLNAAGAITEKGFSEEGMRELTGIHIHETDISGKYIAFEKDQLNDDDMPRLFKSESANLKPYLCALDDEATVYGRDLIHPECARFVLKERNSGGFDAWSAGGPIPEFVLRPLAEHAGVFIYQKNGLPVYANNRMASFFAHKEGSYEIKLPWKTGFIEELYTGEIHEISEKITLNFKTNECKCFLHREN